MIRRSDLLAVWDFDTTFVSGGVTYLFDHGPNSCHLPLTGAGAPNPPTRQTDGSYLFDGANDYLQMTADGAARFWAQLPDGWTDYTFVFKAYYNAPATTDRIFDANDNGNTTGIRFWIRSLSQERLNVSAITVAGNTNFGDNDDIPLTGRTRSSIHSGRFVVAAAPTIFWRTYDQGTRSATPYTTMTDIPVPFDRTVRPNIGRRSTGANFFDGRMYYLAVLKAIPTVDEHDEIQSLLRDGKKPWCRR